MGLGKFESSSNEIKQQASSKLGANIPDGKVKWRIKGMIHFESSKGDTIKIEVEVISCVIKDVFTRNHQGKKAEKVYFMPGDNESKCNEILEGYFKDLKCIFGSMPEGSLNDVNFKKWASDMRGLVVNGQKTSKASTKSTDDVFINVYFNEKSALTPDDIKALEKAGASTFAAKQSTLDTSSPAKPVTSAAPSSDLDDDIPF